MSFNPYMNQAIKYAKMAHLIGEVPVGAVIVKDNEIISFGYNQREKTNDACAHAEILAISAACEKLGDWKLSNCDIYITLEPCPMCAGAILNSRIRRLYYGAFDVQYGAAGSSIDIFSMKGFPHKIEIYGGIMEDICTDMIKSFFKTLRGEAAST